MQVNRVLLFLDKIFNFNYVSISKETFNFQDSFTTNLIEKSCQQTKNSKIYVLCRFSVRWETSIFFGLAPLTMYYIMTGNFDKSSFFQICLKTKQSKSFVTAIKRGIWQSWASLFWLLRVKVNWGDMWRTKIVETHRNLRISRNSWFLKGLPPKK